MKLRFSIILLSMLLLNCLGPFSGTKRVEADAVASVLYVSPGADCLGKLPCYSSPQAAVDAAPAGSVIRLAAGSYSIPAGQNQVLQINKTLILQGGFRPTDWYSPQPITFPTILDAQNLGRVIFINGNPSQPIEVTLEGIQIKNGQANQGGGVNATGVNLSMRRCFVSNNQTAGSGAGIFLSSAANLTMENSRIFSNTSGDMGGGIALQSPTGNASITRSWLFDNTATAGGGAISATGGQVGIEASLLVDNTVIQPAAPGAAVAASGSQVILSHVTIARNTGGAGSGLSLSGASMLSASNLLAAGQVSAMSLTAPSTGAIDGVLWGGGSIWSNGANTVGSGSITVQHAYTGDPLFVGLDPANLNRYFHINETSPARERSVSTLADYTDIDHQALEGIADLGADEYSWSRTDPWGNIIHVDTEPGGDIEVGDADGIPENSRGVIFWNGSQWVSNNTAAHMLFKDIRTQDRLMNYTMLADLNGSNLPEQNIGSYHVSRSTYAYIAPAQEGGAYIIEAAQYRITKNGSQETILLKSRGNGYGQASFDIYIQSTVNTTIAFRSGSAWFNYAETPELASLRAHNDPTGRTGLLTTCDQQAVDHSLYWIDMNGGSDMGGTTYFFHTSAMSTRVSVLGMCFPDEFRMKYMETTNNALEEFRLLPTVYSETLLKSVYIPVIFR